MESINWEAISALAEIIGVVAVAASLVFVGLQIMRNTHATKVAAVQNITSDLITLNFQVGADGDFSKIFYNGWVHPGLLDTDD